MMTEVNMTRKRTLLKLGCRNYSTAMQVKVIRGMPIIMQK